MIDSQDRTREVLEVEHRCRSSQYVWAEKVSCHHRLKCISLLADFQIDILLWSVAEVTDGKRRYLLS